MAGDTTITVVGNMCDAPELRFTPSGAGVANFTIASTPRFLDKASGEWKDGEALFMRCNIWRDAAEHVAESLVKGARVIATGRLRQRSYEAKDGGGKRTVIELEVDEIGPSLKYATAKVTKAPGASSGGFGSREANAGAPRSSARGGDFDDPWATAAPSGSPVKTSNFDDEIPF